MRHPVRALQPGWGVRYRALGITALAAAALALAGCAGTTRVAQFGMLADNEPLVTLVVSEDRDLIRRECLNPVAAGPVLGCQMSRDVAVGEARVRAIKIVRYADVLPSEVTFEIDAHELCHAVAALQGIEDPCHRGNGGVLQASLSPRPTRWP